MSLAAALAVLTALAYVAMTARGTRGPARLVKVVPALALATLAPTPALRVGLVLCALGDGLLLDKARFLLPGMGAFLLGHLALVGGFHQVAEGPPAWAVLVPLLGAVAAVLPRVGRRLHGPLRVAVPVYAAVLVAMATAATALGPLGVAGGLLFFVSDALLAANLFLRPLPGGHVAVMITYYGALMLLTGAVLT